MYRENMKKIEAEPEDEEEMMKFIFQLLILKFLNSWNIRLAKDLITCHWEKLQD